MHRIEGEREVVAKQRLDFIRMEQLLQQGHEVIHAEDERHRHGTDGVLPGPLQRNRRRVNDGIVAEGFGALKNSVRVGRRGGSTVGTVHLHAKVTIGSAGIVTGGKDDASDGLFAGVYQPVKLISAAELHLQTP